MNEPKPYWVRKPHDQDAAIIFVHGVLSEPRNAWRSGKTFWPELICSVDQLREVGVYVFSYRADVFSGKYRISDAVDSLRDYLDLDGLLSFSKLLFVCHSMGGIVVRQFLVNLQTVLIDKRVKIGLFLIASPSLGSEYANLFKGLAKVLGNEQVQALRFADDNTLLNDLDKNFINLKELGRLSIEGKELVEDEFIVLPKFLGSYVVRPFSGAKYFGNSIKIPHSNHFTIAEARDSSAFQHRLLVHFAMKFFTISGEVTADDAFDPVLLEKDEAPKSARTGQLGRLLPFVVVVFCFLVLIFFIVRGRSQKQLFPDLIPLPAVDGKWEIQSIAAADLDNSGKPGLITLNRKPLDTSDPTNDDGTISVLLRVSDAGFEAVKTYKVGKIPYGIAVADFNKDGIPDVAVTNIGTRENQIPRLGTLTVFLGNGDGTLRNAGEYPAGLEPTMPAVGDFNNDGINDLAVGSWADDNVSIFLGKGDGTFGDARKFKASFQTACVAVGHFSSSGNVDIAVANNRQSEVEILLGEGDGTFREARPFPTKPDAEASHVGLWWGPYDILVSDFNEDGHDDLAITNFSDSNVGILLGKGDGSFELPKTFTTDDNPFTLALGDFNGDGKADLVTANNSGTVSVLLGNGDGTFKKKLTYGTAGSSTSIVVGDFNGDGKPDLAIANRDKNFINLMLNSVDLAPTFTRLAIIGTNPTQGFPLTLKAVVTSVNGIPEGRVQFKTEGETLTTQTLKNGEVVFSTSGLRRGNHILIAEYEGAGRYNRSSARTVLNVQ
jgi:hypothetical protein